jgi:5-methylthioadenosine/S-adenosylhomocysteine deaminase
MEKTQASLIIQNGTIVTMDKENRILTDGAVAVRGNTIIEVGDSDTIRGKYSADEVLDATDKVVMPGLVDTYGHAGHGLIKGIYHPEHGWPTGTFYFNATTEDWWHAEGLLSAVERIRFGVTTGLTVVGATPARMDSPVFAKRQAQSAEKAGVRSVIAVGPPDPFVSHLPEPWSGTFWQKGRPVKKEFSFRDTIENTVKIIQDWHHGLDERIQVALHYPYLFGRQAAHPRHPFVYDPEVHVPLMIEKADEVKGLADRYQVLLHSHAFAGSVSFALRHYGRSRVERFLDGKVAFAHCNGLAREEIETLGSHATGICAVPFTHENILYGPCPIIELLQHGANVAISTDGTAPYCSYDLFKDISRAIWNEWMRFQDQTVFPPGKALRMVTIDAANVLGLGQLVGSLEPGKRADVILVDFNRPHLVPGELVPRLLAFYANGNDVESVIVDGKIIMQDRRVISVDEGEVIQSAREEAQKAFERQEIRGYLGMDQDFWTSWKY